MAKQWESLRRRRKGRLVALGAGLLATTALIGLPKAEAAGELTTPEWNAIEGISGDGRVYIGNKFVAAEASSRGFFGTAGGQRRDAAVARHR